MTHTAKAKLFGETQYFKAFTCLKGNQSKHANDQNVMLGNTMMVNANKLDNFVANAYQGKWDNLKDEYQNGNKVEAIAKGAALSWQMRYDSAKASYQEAAYSNGLNPDAAGVAFDAGLIEIGGAGISGFVKGVKVLKNVGNLKISSNTARHINNLHNPNTYAQQLKYKPEASALKELQNKSFFNKNWSSNQIENAVNYGYNKAVAKGVSTGNYTFNYAGETVTISFRDGTLQSAWGSFKYTYQELLNLIR